MLEGVTKQYLVKEWSGGADALGSAQKTYELNEGGFFVSCRMGTIYEPDIKVLLPFGDIAAKIISDYITEQGWHELDLDMIADLCRDEILELTPEQQACFDELEIILVENMAEAQASSETKIAQPKPRILEPA
ncbi:MAG: hypothetical protein AAF549_05150 [Pseudomonadota bacterium]